MDCFVGLQAAVEAEHSTLDGTLTAEDHSSGTMAARNAAICRRFLARPKGFEPLTFGSVASF